MIKFFLLVISSLPRTILHVVYYPVNYCLLSEACVHDRRPLCGTTSDGQFQRQFLDNCDLFEYNCDFNQQYFFTSYEPCNSKQAVENPEDQQSKEVTVGNFKLHSPKEPDKIIDLSTKKDKSPNFGNLCQNCYPPKNWATTVFGETRDFYRVLGDDHHYVKQNNRVFLRNGNQKK